MAKDSKLSAMFFTVVVSHPGFTVREGFLHKD